MFYKSKILRIGLSSEEYLENPIMTRLSTSCWEEEGNGTQKGKILMNPSIGDP